jgi:hypothetical protein
VSNSTRTQRNLVQVVLEIPHVNEVPCCVEGPPLPQTHTHTHKVGLAPCCLASPMQGGCIEGFFFPVDGLVIIHPTRGMSQIWLVVRQGSFKFLESCLLLATYIETHSLATSGDFKNFLFLKIWRLLCLFSKKLFVELTLDY